MSTSSRRSSWQDHHRPRHHHSPSFSSSLLEEIYRSFDQETTDTNHLLNNNNYTDIYRINKQSSVPTYLDAERNRIRRASMSEAATFHRNDHRRQLNYYSTSSSESCSSGTCGFSSSESESLHRSSSRQNNLKPIRTAPNPPENRRSVFSDEVPPAKKKKKKEGNLQRRALKLYGDLKKVKQPISPGGKLATFLNSLFNSKHKIISSPSSNAVNLERDSASAPSTASRSCLSKTPSSAGGRFEKRSVRFVDEEEIIRGHVIRRTSADVARRDSSTLLASDEEFKRQMRDKQRRVEEMAKELLKNYHQKSSRRESTADIASDHHHHRRQYRHDHQDLRKLDYQYDLEGESEDDDDDMSCCSSDLFELENWLEIGVDQRYREELPVYETTRFDLANRAIAI